MQVTDWSGPFWTVSSELLATGWRLGRGTDESSPLKKIENPRTTLAD